MSSRDLQALRDCKNNWSLAEDRRLCGVLEEINKSLTSRISTTSDEIEKSARKIANISVKISNLNNRLSSFSADQFIESRVGDEITTCANPTSTSETTAPNKKVEATNNLRVAVSMGLELMRTRFKRIDMRPEDFDEDDDPTFMPEPIFEPYDESLSRPLPFLIGTPDWNSSSCAGTSEEYVETTKITEEVVISLPPFAQPRIATSTDSSQSNLLTEKAMHGTSSQATSSASSTEGFGIKINKYSNEYDRTYAPQDVVATSTLHSSSQKEAEIGKATGSIFDSSKNEASDSEASLRCRNPEVPARCPDSEVPRKRSDAEIVAKRSLPTHAIKDQSKKNVNEGASNGLKNLFVDSSSDEDDLFSDFRNTSMKPKQYEVPVRSNNSQAYQTIEKQKKTNLQKTDEKVGSSAVPADVSQPKNSLTKKMSDTTGSDTENGETPNAFRKKLDGILSSKIMMPNTTNALEKSQMKENTGEITKNDVTNAVLPSLAKLRARGPPRRSPSRLLQQSNKNDINDEVESVCTSEATSANAEGDQDNVHRKVATREERHVEPELIDSGKRVPQNVNNMKQKKDINSIFSSDSDDDIFSAFPSNRSKISSDVPNSHVPQVRRSGFQPVQASVERPSVRSASRIQTPQTGSKSKSLFDSDDEDIFASNTTVKKQQPKQQQSVNEKEVSSENVREMIFPRKGLTSERKEVAVPEKKPNTPKPRTVDIFGDDSDDDDLFK